MGAQSRDPGDEDTVSVFESDGYIVARDEKTGVASQGKTKSEALANLAEALELKEQTVASGDDLEDASAPWFNS